MNNTSSPTITPEEKERRKEAVAYATASSELSGFKTSLFANKLHQKYIEGEISIEEMQKTLFEYYRD